MHTGVDPLHIQLGLQPVRRLKVPSPLGGHPLVQLALLLRCQRAPLSHGDQDTPGVSFAEAEAAPDAARLL